MAFKRDTVRAELIELANQINFAASARIVDLILERYDVTRRPLKPEK